MSGPQFQFIRRETSVLTGLPNLEHLFSLPDFPVYMGCTDQPRSADVAAELSFSVCRDTGVAQVDLLPPLELLYQLPHNDATGAMWRRHHEAFADFIARRPFRRALDIGSPSDFLARRALAANPGAGWTIVEPGPVAIDLPEITLIKDFFRDGLSLEPGFDLVVHSHVLEHAFDPEAFIGQIARYAAPGARLAFSYPNLQAMLERGYTNCVNFEHSIFLAEYYVDAILKRQGFAIEEKVYFGDPHSIFYAAVHTGEKQDVPFPNHYGTNRALMLDFYNRHCDFVARINAQMAEVKGPIYLFGAHIFSQYLLAFGLDGGRIAGVLDNSPMKIGKRLYGTDFMVSHPDTLRGLGEVGVVLKVEQYRAEIVEQLQGLNPAARLLE